MASYKLDFSQPDKKTQLRQKRSRHWGFTVLAGILAFGFALLFFNGINSAFKPKNKAVLLQHQHQKLLVRYDSLYEAKKQADRQLNQLMLKEQSAK